MCDSELARCHMDSWEQWYSSCEAIRELADIHRSNDAHDDSQWAGATRNLRSTLIPATQKQKSESSPQCSIWSYKWPQMRINHSTVRLSRIRYYSDEEEIIESRDSEECSIMCDLSSWKWNSFLMRIVSRWQSRAAMKLIPHIDMGHKHWGHEHFLKSSLWDGGLTGCCEGTLLRVRATWRLIHRRGKPGGEQEWLMTRVRLLIQSIKKGL